VQMRLNSASRCSAIKTLAGCSKATLKVALTILAISGCSGHVLMNKPILHKWLKSGYLEKQVLYDTVSGTPQGGLNFPCVGKSGA